MPRRLKDFFVSLDSLSHGPVGLGKLVAEVNSLHAVVVVNYNLVLSSTDSWAVRRKSYHFAGVDCGEHGDRPLVHPLKGEHT